ncbi:indian hedgehog B protein-like [Macrobrachium nipponense]|uniref:indian hedgehog B protein-like n=1 Tax=Macrobrachium nipponense TaxID=159736 RepID=UPI0030C80E30
MVGGPQGLFIVVLVLSRTFALPQPPLSTEDVTDYEDGPTNMFVRQTRKHARPMFYINCSYRDLCYCYSKITRHHYCCSCDVGACFPGTAKVSTSAGAFTTMDKLRTGDDVLAVDESGKIVASQVLGFMDRRPSEISLYVTLRTAAGQNLTLSPNHVLFKSALNSSHPVSTFGSDISIGDVIFSVNKTGLERTRVVAVEHSVIQGAYVPLTKEGTLIVDGTMVSCYASYRHSLAHAFLAPVRAFPLLLWPRPGFFSNLGLLMKNVINGFGENSLEFLKDFFTGHHEIKQSMEGILHYSEPRGHFTSEPEIRKKETLHYSSFTSEDATMLEGEGEAFYITLVKLIGWLLFRDEKAVTPVIQLNPQVQWDGFSQLFISSSAFTNIQSAILQLVTRSW